MIIPFIGPFIIIILSDLCYYGRSWTIHKWKVVLIFCVSIGCVPLCKCLIWRISKMIKSRGSRFIGHVKHAILPILVTAFAKFWSRVTPKVSFFKKNCTRFLSTRESRDYLEFLIVTCTKFCLKDISNILIVTFPFTRETRKCANKLATCANNFVSSTSKSLVFKKLFTHYHVYSYTWDTRWCLYFFYSIPVGNLKIVEIVFETVFDRESNKNGLIFFRGVSIL